MKDCPPDCLIKHKIEKRLKHYSYFFDTPCEDCEWNKEHRVRCLECGKIHRDGEHIISNIIHARGEL